jgi:hypothetical protein
MMTCFLTLHLAMNVLCQSAAAAPGKSPVETG